MTHATCLRSGWTCADYANSAEAGEDYCGTAGSGEACCYCGGGSGSSIACDNGCQDLDGWTDSDGWTCMNYLFAAENYCG
jgi:hypothetical protein